MGVVENIQLACAVCRIGIYTVFRRLCCKKPPPPRPEFPVICIGLKDAGKSTLFALLCGHGTDDIVPTAGFLINATMFKDCIINAKEIGGGENTRKFWKHYYAGSEGIIYVIDSASSTDDMKTTKALLHDALTDPALRFLPLVVLANCQDKAGAQSPDEIKEYLELKSLCTDRPWLVIGCTKDNTDALRKDMDAFNQLLLAAKQGESSPVGEIGEINRI